MAIEFYWNRQAAKRYLTKWRQGLYIGLFLIPLYFFCNLGYLLHRRSNGTVAFYLVGTLIVLFPVFRFFYGSIFFENQTVNSIKFEPEEILISTVSFTLFGFVKMRAIEKKFKKGEVGLEPYVGKSRFNKTYFGEIYFLVEGNKQYRIAENLFDDFIGLKEALEIFFGQMLDTL